MLEGRIDPPRPSYHRVTRPNHNVSPGLAESYARQVMERPAAYIAQRADGSTVGTVAYEIQSATRALCHEGADCTTIRTLSLADLHAHGLHDLAERLVDESRTAYDVARADAAEHYQ